MSEIGWNWMNPHWDWFLFPETKYIYIAELVVFDKVKLNSGRKRVKLKDLYKANSTQEKQRWLSYMENTYETDVEIYIKRKKRQQ